MRSEEEIRGLINLFEEWDDLTEFYCLNCKRAFKKDEKMCNVEHTFLFCSGNEQTEDRLATGLRFIIEGEPRFSIAELEKIIRCKIKSDLKNRNWLKLTPLNEEDILKFSYKELLDFLKDSKKVEKVLK